MSQFNRQYLYKNNDKDFETQRKNRNDHCVEIRKAKKEDILQKMRNINLADEPHDNNMINNQISENEFTISEIKLMLQSKDLDKITQAVTCSRRKLSRTKIPPIEDFFKNGIIPLFVETLKSNNNEVVIFESVWVITNITSDESIYTDAIVNAGAIPILIYLMMHSLDAISEQSIWAVSNITGDSAHYRDMMISNGIIPILNNLIIRFWDKVGSLRRICWLISNLFKKNSKFYPIDSVLEMLPIILHIMTNIEDFQCKFYLTHALYYASRDYDEIINGLIDLDLLKIVKDNLNKEAKIVLPSLRVLGNVVAGTNEQANVVIKSGLIESLSQLINHSDPRIVRETCWIASNIGAGTVEQMSTLIHSGLVLSVLNVMKNGDYKSQKEATWAVINIIHKSLDEHNFYLLNNNVFNAMIPMMTCNDVTLVIEILKSINTLFESVEKIGQLEKCVEIFRTAGGVVNLENLQYHESSEVYTKSYNILNNFIGIDEEESNEMDEFVDYFMF